MAEVDLKDDDQTLDQSNSGESDDQTDDSVDDTQDDQSQGQAGDDDAGDSQDDDTEGKKTRGEVRHERYIDKLATEIRQSNEQSNRYTEELFTPKPYEPLQYKEGEEYDPKQLEDDRNKVADNKFSEGLRTGINQSTSQVTKELWSDRFDIDSERVTTKYAVLNPESDDYRPKLEASLVQKYIAFAGVEKDDKGRISISKPGIRFKDFVQAEMQNLEDYAAHRSAASSKNLVTQAARTGIKPHGAARTSKGGHGFDANDPAGSVARMTSKQYFELGGKEASDAYLAKKGLA